MRPFLFEYLHECNVELGEEDLLACGERFVGGNLDDFSNDITLDAIALVGGKHIPSG